MISPYIEDLITSFTHLPGIGPKSAQRLAFHVLNNPRHRDQAKHLAHALCQAADNIGYCEKCLTFCERAICQLCLSEKRDSDVLCIVESPLDIIAIEQTAQYRGRYFVLHGHLSPLDGIGPDDIHIPQLTKRLQEDTFKEVIIATSATAEGEATTHYLTRLLKAHNHKVSRLAYGIPFGCELEYVGHTTLKHALLEREHV